MRGTSLKSGVGVGNSTSGVVVEMRLDVTADDSSQRPDEVVDLSWVGASNSVGDTDSVDANLVDGSVNRQKVDQLGSERVF